jgi:hypothetical protein
MTKHGDTPSKIGLDAIVQATQASVSSELADEVVILHLANGVYYGLNPLGARIWQLVQQPRRVSDVRDHILAEYAVERERCERDVLALLQDLQAAGLIEVGS